MNQQSKRKGIKLKLWEEIFLKLYEYIKNNNGIKILLQTKSFDIFLHQFIENFY